MDQIINLLDEPLILVFIILFFGSWLGQIKIKGLSLGAAGVLLVAMVFGHFGYEVSPIVQNLGLSLFIVAIGLQAGPRFFRMMRSKGMIFGLISLSIILISVITTVIVAKVFHLSAPLSVGLKIGRASCRERVGVARGCAWADEGWMQVQPSRGGRAAVV